MAMFESEGFCPSNSFLRGFMAMEVAMGDNEKLKLMVGDLMDALGQRDGYMVYAQNEIQYGCRECSIVEAICEDGFRGASLVFHLREIVPECKYAEKGRKIVLHDVVNPGQLGVYALSSYEEYTVWSFRPKDGGPVYPDNPLTKEGTRAIFSTKKYVIVVDNNGGTYDDQVDIYLCRVK